MIIREEMKQYMYPEPGLELGCGGLRTCDHAIQVDICDNFNGFKYDVDYLHPIDSLPMFQNKKFGYIAHSNVIEHLPNPLVALDEWRRVLKRNGHLISIVPDYRIWPPDRDKTPSTVQDAIIAKEEGLKNQPDDWRDRKKAFWNKHYYFWTPNTYLDLLDACGDWEVVRVIKNKPYMMQRLIAAVPAITETLKAGDCWNRMDSLQHSVGAPRLGHNFVVVVKKV